MMWLGLIDALKILDPTKIKIARKTGDVKSLRKIYTPQGFKEGGKFLRGVVTKPVGGFVEGFMGKGAYGYATGKQGWLPDLWGEKPTGKGIFEEAIGKTGDTAGKGMLEGIIPDTGLVTIVIPEFPKIPKFPKIPEFPKIDIEMPFAGVEMPSLEAFDEEGAPNYLILGGLALIAYTVLTGKV